MNDALIYLFVLSFFFSFFFFQLPPLNTHNLNHPLTVFKLEVDAHNAILNIIDCNYLFFFFFFTSDVITANSRNSLLCEGTKSQADKVAETVCSGFQQSLGNRGLSERDESLTVIRKVEFSNCFYHLEYHNPVNKLSTVYSPSF